MESSLHLYQPPLFRARDGGWHESFGEAVHHSASRLTWDPAAILSVLSFGYVCGDRTLVSEIGRQPWLSEIGADGKPWLENVPGHDTLWVSSGEIARRLGRLLCDEVLQVCQGRKEICVLLSGGLDSRVVAGVLARLLGEGSLTAKPVALTWGLPDSRDVAYGRAVAQLLGFEWVHLEIGPEDLEVSVNELAAVSGCLFSPVHFHCMRWFPTVSKDALVLAASYGDSVGRAEFSKTHLLELKYLRPANTFGLMSSAAMDIANSYLQADLTALGKRAEGRPKYAICECEMQAHYMRGLIAQAMRVIDSYCTVYQMFTHPSVYSYMWSIHPALRFDNVYAELLQQLDPRLARLPWARTNKALKGRTQGARAGLRRSFHDYAAWIGGPLYDELSRAVDPVWFAETGIFRAERVAALCEEVRCGPKGFRSYDIFVWLAGFRRLADWLGEQGKQVKLGETLQGNSVTVPQPVPEQRVGRLRAALRRSPVLHQLAKKARRLFLKYDARRRYPPRVVP